MRNSTSLKCIPSTNKSGKENKHWVHPSENLIKGQVFYVVKFLGDIGVDQPKGITLVQDAIPKLRARRGSSNTAYKLPKMELCIGVEGVVIRHPKTKAIHHQYPLYQITYFTDEKVEKQFVSFIVKEADSERYRCFVFYSDRYSEEIVSTLRQSFDLAFKSSINKPNKLSFRSRQLDVLKAMPIHIAEEISGVTEATEIKRSVPQMPTGMEKDEECEHHLQRAIVTGTVIPTPEVVHIDTPSLTKYYKTYPIIYTKPKQLVRMHPFALEQEYVEYDADSEDEQWLNNQGFKLEKDRFEMMIDKLDRNSNYSVISLSEFNNLMKCHDEVTIDRFEVIEINAAVYDYWLAKRLLLTCLLPTVKTEVGNGPANDPYIAFRRRKDKMQTRKNRKNDEASYEKMLKLKKDLNTVQQLFQLVQQREIEKLEVLKIQKEIYEKRYEGRDFSGNLIQDVKNWKREAAAYAVALTLQKHQHMYGGPLANCPIRPVLQKQQSLVNWAMSSSAASVVANSYAHINNNGCISTSVSRPSELKQALARPAVTSIHQLQDEDDDPSDLNSPRQREKRRYKKRRHNRTALNHVSYLNQSAYDAGSDADADDERPDGSPANSIIGVNASSVPEIGNDVISSDTPEEEFAFRRLQHCSYLPPIKEPWDYEVDSVWGNSKDRRYYQTYLKAAPVRNGVILARPVLKNIGFARRRMCRGGRIAIDRVKYTQNDVWSKLDFNVLENRSEAATDDIFTKYKLRSPSASSSDSDNDIDGYSNCDARDETAEFLSVDEDDEMDAQLYPNPIIEVQNLEMMDEEKLYLEVELNKPLQKEKSIAILDRLVTIATATNAKNNNQSNTIAKTIESLNSLANRRHNSDGGSILDRWTRASSNSPLKCHNHHKNSNGNGTAISSIRSSIDTNFTNFNNTASSGEDADTTTTVDKLVGCSTFKTVHEDYFMKSLKMKGYAENVARYSNSITVPTAATSSDKPLPQLLMTEGDWKL